LYALYKQATEGDINIQRPGLFDVVGRAKWLDLYIIYLLCDNKLIYAFYNDTNKIHHNKRDAWEKLKSINSLNAKHAYVEALLKATTEVITNDRIKKNSVRLISLYLLGI
jgi:acyl-CoA-binding protein